MQMSVRNFKAVFQKILNTVLTQHRDPGVELDGSDVTVRHTVLVFLPSPFDKEVENGMVKVYGTTLGEVIHNVDTRVNGIREYISSGLQVRESISVFINGRHSSGDFNTLVPDGAEIEFVRKISGGLGL